MSACGKCGAAGGPGVELRQQDGAEGLRCVSCYADSQPRPDGAYARSLASIEPEEIDWLWEDRIPLGMLSMICGDPGLGKSLLTMNLAAKVSRAGGDVLLLSGEDSPALMIRPRAEVMGADLSRIHPVAMSVAGLDKGLVLPDDCESLDRLVEEYSARLVVVDPVMGHLAAGINSWSDKDMRTALGPLNYIAERRRCAFVFVYHLNKAKGDNALYRIGGSIGSIAAVRSALLLARDPEDTEGERGNQRVLAHIKSNVSPLAESLQYEVENQQDKKVPPRILEIGKSAATGSDLLETSSGEERNERVDAKDFLRIELADGPKPVRGLIKDAPCGERTLRKAKKELGIEQHKGGFNTGWEWSLPEGCTPEGCTTNMSPGAAFVDSALASQKDNGDFPKAAPESISAAFANGNGSVPASPEQEAEIRRAARKFGESV